MTLFEYSKTIPGICFMTDMSGRIIRRGLRVRPEAVRAGKSVSGSISDRTFVLTDIADGECRSVGIDSSRGATDAFVIREKEYAFWFVTRGTSGMLLPALKTLKEASAESFAEALSAARSGAAAETLFSVGAAAAAKRLCPRGTELSDLIEAIGLCAVLLFGDELIALPDLIPENAVIAEADISAVGKLLLSMCESGNRAEAVFEADKLVLRCGGETVSEIGYTVRVPSVVFTVRPYVCSNVSAVLAVTGASAFELSPEVGKHLRKYGARTDE